MSNKSPFNSVLVPTDFSDFSTAAFEWALKCVDREDSSIIVLHVLDSAMVETIAEHEFAAREEVSTRMRQQADARMVEYADRGGEIEIDTMVVEGVPFLEIVRKAEDFAVDAIIMGRVGMRGQIEKLLFGSNAEKVIRGARRPVLVLPAEL